MSGKSSGRNSGQKRKADQHDDKEALAAKSNKQNKSSNYSNEEKKYTRADLIELLSEYIPENILNEWHINTMRRFKKAKENQSTACEEANKIWAEMQDLIGEGFKYPYRIQMYIWGDCFYGERLILMAFFWINGLHPDLFYEFLEARGVKSAESRIKHFKSIQVSFEKNPERYKKLYGFNVTNNRYERFDGTRMEYTRRCERNGQSNDEVSYEVDDDAIVQALEKFEQSLGSDQLEAAAAAENQNEPKAGNNEDVHHVQEVGAGMDVQPVPQVQNVVIDLPSDAVYDFDQKEDNCAGGSNGNSIAKQSPPLVNNEELHVDKKDSDEQTVVPDSQEEEEQDPKFLMNPDQPGWEEKCESDDDESEDNKFDCDEYVSDSCPSDKEEDGHDKPDTQCEAPSDDWYSPLTSVLTSIDNTRDCTDSSVREQEEITRGSQSTATNITGQRDIDGQAIENIWKVVIRRSDGTYKIFPNIAGSFWLQSETRGQAGKVLLFEQRQSEEPLSHATISPNDLTQQKSTTPDAKREIETVREAEEIQSQNTSSTLVAATVAHHNKLEQEERESTEPSADRQQLHSSPLDQNEVVHDKCNCSEDLFDDLDREIPLNEIINSQESVDETQEYVTLSNGQVVVVKLTDDEPANSLLNMTHVADNIGQITLDNCDRAKSLCPKRSSDEEKADMNFLGLYHTCCVDQHFVEPEMVNYDDKIPSTDVVVKKKTILIGCEEHKKYYADINHKWSAAYSEPGPSSDADMFDSSQPEFKHPRILTQYWKSKELRKKSVRFNNTLTIINTNEHRIIREITSQICERRRKELIRSRLSKKTKEIVLTSNDDTLMIDDLQLTDEQANPLVTSQGPPIVQVVNQTTK